MYDRNYINLLLFQRKHHVISINYATYQYFFSDCRQTLILNAIIIYILLKIITFAYFKISEFVHVNKFKTIDKTYTKLDHKTV